ncbi:MAG TPA: holo-ACP synthase [Spirochaetota bacterium]|nr:holo-ACP synthase [Spirochaetota bacterium]HOL57482.1 holo-ACP synthase [Spirochaetota bacterium]HPP05035.1 holo-ACP synthase [Spirochaetota bacterium]
MFGIGIDICNVKRFDRLKENHNFLKRVFSDNELDLCMKRKNVSQCLAARFAAKEAFLKAIGTGIGNGISIKEVIIKKDEKGKPFILLEGNTKKYYEEINGGNIHLSISHEKDVAVAVVVIEKF